MAPLLLPRKIGNIDQKTLDSLKHLDLTGKVFYKNRDARGQGAFSEVFMGSCYVQGRGEVNIAMKRLRFHVGTMDCKRVRGRLLPRFQGFANMDVQTF